MYRIAYCLLWLPMQLLFPTRVVGKQNIPQGGAVLACNHYSYVDSVLVGLSIFRKQYFLAKAELFRSRLLGAFLRALHAIPIHRAQADISAIKRCVSVLKNNKLLTVFPEGTRNQNSEEMAQIKSGLVLFAIKAQKPIVPMLLVRRPRLFRLNQLIVGAPIDLSPFYGKPITKEVLAEGSVAVTNAIASLKH